MRFASLRRLRVPGMALPQTLIRIAPLLRETLSLDRERLSRPRRAQVKVSRRLETNETNEAVESVEASTVWGPTRWAAVDQLAQRLECAIRAASRATCEQPLGE